MPAYTPSSRLERRRWRLTLNRLCLALNLARRECPMSEPTSPNRRPVSQHYSPSCRARYEWSEVLDPAAEVLYARFREKYVTSLNRWAYDMLQYAAAALVRPPGWVLFVGRGICPGPRAAAAAMARGNAVDLDSDWWVGLGLPASLVDRLELLRTGGYRCEVTAEEAVTVED